MIKNKFIFTLFLLLLSDVSWAADTLDTGDSAWILTSTALVLFMTLPGLALFYGGLVRTKNVLSVLMQCFSIAAFASVVWFVIGYSLAFSEEGCFFVGGFDRAFLSGLTKSSVSGTLPESVFVMFQMTFAIITPALIVGGFAERMKFSSMLLFSMLWLLIVYIPTTHWVWGGGWLSQMGFYDYAGGTVVHINAGIAALVAALILGPRRGFGSSALMPHNLTMTVSGAAMLWVGWFGFNAGSALAANQDAGMAMLVTHLGAAGGVVSWMLMEWIRHGKPSVLGAVTGMVAGLGTITPASGYIGPAAGLCIGLTAGIICYFATALLKQKLRIDDSLDVMPVHGVGGILGTLCAGIFASESLGGFGFGDGNATMTDQVLVQLAGIGATIAWCAICTFILLKLVGLVTGGLRINSEEEVQGLDIISHDEAGYNL
ncbi:MAG: ammonium transporter [Gammaproteobacteria bacterium]|nr:ammonium transporter [Gammaproteobacteria bacterium]